MNSNLVVIVDDEGRRNFKNVGNRWFSEARNVDDQEYLIETPLGEERKVVGTLVKNPNLGAHSEEFLYLEATLDCNFRCKHCGVVSDLESGDEESARYVSTQFARELGNAIKTNNRLTGRNFFFGGGEPLISIDKFVQVKEAIGELERTQLVISTNGYNLPLDQNEFNGMMDAIGRPFVMLSCGAAHRDQYARLALSNGHELYVPQNIDPSNALFEKARIIGGYCADLGMGFNVNVVERGDEVSGDLRRFIMEHALTGFKYFSTRVDLDPNPCKQGQELAIRANGDVYTHCYDIFNGKNKLGVVGFLK